MGMSKTVIKNKHLFYIPLVIVFAIALVGVLAWDTMKDANKKNGFTRNFIHKDYPRVISSLAKDPEIIELCGSTPSALYFKSKNPKHILITDYDIKTKRYENINSPDDKRISQAYNCFVDSPRIILIANNIPETIITGLSIQPMTHRFPKYLFTRASMLGPSSFVFRGFDPKFKDEQIFIKGNLSSDSLVPENNLSTLGNHDGGIATDGLLHFNKKSNLLSYVYFYRNEFICMDTNLNLIYKGHTIDHVVNSEFFGGSVSGNKSTLYTNVGPRKIINYESTVTDNYIYINSKIRADNEETNTFLNNSVIDVYSNKKGIYVGSFYIPKYNGEKMDRFFLLNNFLFVLYKSNIVKYNIAFNNELGSL